MKHNNLYFVPSLTHTVPIHTTKNDKHWYSQNSPESYFSNHTCYLSHIVPSLPVHTSKENLHQQLQFAIQILHVLIQTTFCSHCTLYTFVLHALQPFAPSMWIFHSLIPRPSPTFSFRLLHNNWMVAKTWEVGTRLDISHSGSLSVWQFH